MGKPIFINLGASHPAWLHAGPWHWGLYFNHPWGHTPWGWLLFFLESVIKNAIFAIVLVLLAAYGIAGALSLKESKATIEKATSNRLAAIEAVL